MKPLDFNGSKRHTRARMTSRAWYAVFGADRIQPGQRISSSDLAERLQAVYDDIEPVEIMGVMENYTHHRNQLIRGES